VLIFFLLQKTIQRSNLPLHWLHLEVYELVLAIVKILKQITFTLLVRKRIVLAECRISDVFVLHSQLFKLSDNTRDLCLLVHAFYWTHFMWRATFTEYFFDNVEDLKVCLKVLGLHIQGPLAAIAVD